MAFEYTDDQRKVIDTRGKDILVSAAAGSGKTAVLVERIAKMVCDDENPVDIDRLLVVTFTNAAASEMRERIGEAIAKRIEANPDSEHLAKQAVLLHNAKICTIDSFCSNVLRNNFNEIDSEPGYRTPDSAEITLMRQDVLSALLEDFFAETDEAKKQEFRECVEFFSPEVRENKLEEVILNLYRTSESAPFPDKWLDRFYDEPIPASIEELEETPFMKDFIKEIKDSLNQIIDVYKEAIALAESPDGPYIYGELLENEKEAVEAILKKETYNNIQAGVQAIAYASLSRTSDDAINPAKRERAKDLRNTAKALMGDLKKNLLVSEETLLKREQACMKAVKQVINLTREFADRYSEYKKDRNIMEFSDVAHAALKILVAGIDESGNPIPTDTARELGARFDEVLVDEYQDTNYIQEYILKVLTLDKAAGKHMFMVGDVKQSIYRFRKARPDLFIEKYKDFRVADEGKERIDLQMNFRSRDEVLKITNDIFSRIMDESYGGINYDKEAALYLGFEDYTEYKEAFPELMIAIPSEEGTNPKASEAELIAGKILSMVGKYQVWDKKEERMRPCHFKDMVLLQRSSDSEDTLLHVLEDKGIPVYKESTGGYYETPEIRDVLQLLRVIDNPTRDIAMCGTLKSHFGGFSDEEIARVRVILGDKTKCNLYENLKRALNNECVDSILQEKIQIFLQRIQLYRDMSEYMPVRELLGHIFKDFKYLEYVSALPAGGRRLANSKLLLVKAGDFEKTSFHGLFHFVRYIEQLEKYEADEGEAGLNDENADVVRIMTIHKSKGLEFPITFITNLSKKFNDMDANNSFVIDDDFGIGTTYIDVVNRFKAGSVRKNIISNKIKRDSRAEELRVLYVAMTRAREKLIMTTSLKKKEDLVSLLKDMISIRYKDNWRLSGRDLDCDSYFKYILKALIRHPAIEPLLDELEIERDAVKEIPAPYDFVGDESEKDILITLASEDEIIVDEGERRARTELLGDALKAGKLPSSIDEKYYETLVNGFNFVYPHENLKDLYTKTSVSELKMAALAEEGEPVKELFNEEEKKPYVPAFKKTVGEVSGTTRGSAFHKIMELIDIGKFTSMPSDKKERLTELKSDMDEFVKSEKLTKEYYDAIIPERVLDFLDSDLAKRMGEAQKKGLLFREQPFVYGIPANVINPDFPKEESILIQGIIDAFFIENGKAILMDYKTDVVESRDALKDRYKIQLDYYKSAIESARNMPVTETYIYSTRFASEILLD